MPRQTRARKRKGYGKATALAERIGRAKSDQSSRSLKHARKLALELGEEAFALNTKNPGDIVWSRGWFSEPYQRAVGALAEGRTDKALNALHQAARMAESVSSRTK